MIDMEFGIRAAQERRRKQLDDGRDISKREVAKAIGVAESTVLRIEAGNVPEHDTLEALARFYGVTVAWLRYGALPREASPSLTVSRPESVVLPGQRSAGGVPMTTPAAPTKKARGAGRRRGHG